jgi:hypothetical protein
MRLEMGIYGVFVAWKREECESGIFYGWRMGATETQDYTTCIKLGMLLLSCLLVGHQSIDCPGLLYIRKTIS